MGAPNSSTKDLSIAAQLTRSGIAKQHYSVSVLLASLSDAAQFHWMPGFKGRLTKMTFVTQVVASTAARASTLTPSIGGTNVTGGVLALTTVACNTKDKELAGTAITANNAFTATQNITITGSSTTAFAEGSGYVQLEVVNDELLETLALAMGGYRTP